VFHNPGTVPHPDFANPGPDATTVVEESYAQYQSAQLQERLSLVPYDRERCCYMVHSVPREEVRGLVEGLRTRGRYLFVTDVSEHYYVQFGSSWNEFIEAMQLD
jgi:hypothetical protein